MIKNISLIICALTFFVTQSYAQKNNLNTYKYIIVPVQYEFQKTEDAYQINSLTKFLFNRAGFNVFLSNEKFPEDAAKNACTTLKAIVVNKSSLLSTKMQIKLVDCFNNDVYITEEATSRIKDYKRAYHEAIREAFVELEDLNYKFQEPVSEVAQAEKVVESSPSRPIVKEVVEAVDDIQPKKETVTETKVEEIKVVDEQVEKVTEKKKSITKPIQEEIKEIDIKPAKLSIEGNYYVEKWGVCTISKNEDGYSFKGGDENFEFAVLYKTSKPHMFIIKYAAFKQPQLVELDGNGNLKVDTENGVKIYKKVN